MFGEMERSFRIEPAKNGFVVHTYEVVEGPPSALEAELGYNIGREIVDAGGEPPRIVDRVRSYPVTYVCTTLDEVIERLKNHFSPMDSSFLEQKHIVLGRVTWGRDEFGDYWSAPFRDAKTGKGGLTGSYYDIDGDERRSREEQEAELKLYGAGTEQGKG